MLCLTLDLSSRCFECAATEPPCFAASLACPCLSMHLVRTASWRLQRYRPVGGHSHKPSPKLSSEHRSRLLDDILLLARSQPCYLSSFQVFKSTPGLHDFGFPFKLDALDLQSFPRFPSFAPWTFPSCKVFGQKFNWNCRYNHQECHPLACTVETYITITFWSRDPKWQQQLNIPVLILQGRSVFWWVATMLQSFHKTWRLPGGCCKSTAGVYDLNMLDMSVFLLVHMGILNWSFHVDTLSRHAGEKAWSAEVIIASSCAFFLESFDARCPCTVYDIDSWHDIVAVSCCVSVATIAISISFGFFRHDQ